MQTFSTRLRKVRMVSCSDSVAWLKLLITSHSMLIIDLLKFLQVANATK